MTRPEALALVSRLAVGLAPDVAGVARLLERIAQDDRAEEMRAALVEHGAAALLDEAHGRASDGMGDRA